jgi:hypothetical protein
MKRLLHELSAYNSAAALLEENAGWHAVVKMLLDIIEWLSKDYFALKGKYDLLSDAYNILNGEKGRPNIKSNKKKSGDISSELERKLAESKANNQDENSGCEETKASNKNETQHRESKTDHIKIDREEVCRLNRVGLPDDLVFKDYEEIVIQELIIKTDNVKYIRERFYSPSTGMSYLADLPVGVQDKGRYAPGIRSMIPILRTECNMSIKATHGFFTNFGVDVSKTYITKIFTNKFQIFHDEKDDIYRSGVANSPFVQIDDTGQRVNGVNQYGQVLCSPLFTAYSTTEAKDRMTALSVLINFTPIRYLYNDDAIALLDDFKLATKTKAAIKLQLTPDVEMSEEEFNKNIEVIKLHVKLGPNQTTRLREACAITWYQQQTEYPIIETLLADDAPQFKLLTRFLGLCWIHDGRHYKKLIPVVLENQLALKDFRGKFWDFYAELLKYKINPTPEKKVMLLLEFDKLFSTTTCYADLNDRILKTLAKKDKLLRVLDLPQLPLHNNGTEIEVRAVKRKSDVSYQTRNNKGTKALNTFMTINQTCKKMGVSFYQYVYDRESGQFKLPSLAVLIAEKAKATWVKHTTEAVDGRAPKM